MSATTIPDRPPADPDDAETLTPVTLEGLIIRHIRTAQLWEDDIVVVSFPQRLEPSQARDIMDLIRDKFPYPGHRVCVLDNGATLGHAPLAIYNRLSAALTENDLLSGQIVAAERRIAELEAELAAERAAGFGLGRGE